MRLIWPKRETKNFLDQGWTGYSRGSPSGKSPEPNNNCRLCERRAPGVSAIALIATPCRLLLESLFDDFA
jgi:hypothetical protein